MHRLHLLLAGMIACALCVGASAGARAQNGDRGSVGSPDPPGLEGVRDAMVDLRLGDAERAIYGLSPEDRRRPITQLHLATTSLLRVLLNDRPSDYDRFFERSDSLLEVLDGRVGSRHAWLTSEAYLQRLWAWSKKGEYARAALAGNSAYVSAERAVTLNPDEYGAYKARGLLHIAVGAVPATFQRFLRLLGYDGGIEQGVLELQTAADRSAFARFESLVFLATLDLYDYPSSLDAIETYESLARTHPDSPLVALLLSDAYLRRRRAQDALREAERGLDLTMRSGVESVDYLLHFRAEALYRLNRFEEAASSYEAYTDSHRGPALKPRAHLYRGISLEMLGRRQEAVEAYRTVSAERIFGEDAAAARKAGKLVEEPMDEIDRRTLRARNLFNAGLEEQALAAYRAILIDPKADAPARGPVTYGMARAYHETDRLREAATWYEQTLEEPGDVSGKWAPWSLYHLSEIYEETGRKDAAVAVLDRLLNYPHRYDFQARLENQARLRRDRLAK